MERLITTPGSVPKEAFAPRRDRFANNLVYRPADRIFSVMAGNWSPGQTTPIHDPLTWAVVGGCEGEERDSICSRSDEGSNRRRARSEVVGQSITEKSHV